MEAELNGPQRKVVSSSVAPRRISHGESGIPLRDGKTLPFTVTREWSAPAGHYEERWFLINPETREVLFEGPARRALVWGLQSLTELTDEVTEPISLQPGTYSVVFALGRLMGGEFEVEAAEVSSEAA
ncbi:MAG: hypothetical protein M3280_04175 [Actinomycetota bacterium]|nr:hypothetical protein [Actinomycetota bacterium]